jgi:small GTP-binding protein
MPSAGGSAALPTAVVKERLNALRLERGSESKLEREKNEFLSVEDDNEADEGGEEQSQRNISMQLRRKSSRLHVGADPVALLRVPSRAQQFQSPNNASSTHRSKFMIVGDLAVGKTCLSETCTKGTFESTHKPTVGMDFSQSVLDVGQQQLWVALWHMSSSVGGQDNLNVLHFRGVHGVFIMCDITQPKTLQNIDAWKARVDDCIKKAGHGDIPVIVLVNKMDMLGEEGISFDLKAFDKQCRKMQVDARYFISCKQETNIELAIKDMLRIVLDKRTALTAPGLAALGEDTLKTLASEVQELKRVQVNPLVGQEGKSADKKASATAAAAVTATEAAAAPPPQSSSSPPLESSAVPPTATGVSAGCQCAIS